MTAMLDDDFDQYREYVFDVPGVSHPDPNTMVFVMPSANVKVSAAFTDYTQYG